MGASLGLECLVAVVNPYVWLSMSNLVVIGGGGSGIQMDSMLYWIVTAIPVAHF